MRKRIRILYKLVALNLYRKPKSVVKLLLRPSKYCVHESYFPDKPKKSKLRILFDQLTETLKYGYPNEFYFPYGFDVKSNSEMSEYLHYGPFMQLRDSRNLKLHSSTAVLRDKVLFGMFTSNYGVNSAKNIAYSTSEGLFDVNDKTYISINNFIKKYDGYDLFAKPIDGECGCGILHITIMDGNISRNGEIISIDDLLQTINSARYLIQSKVIQNKLMKELHPQSINTIRLVTINNPNTKHPEVFPSILRIGTGNSIVDNTSQGGLAVGINLYTGRLKEYGFYKPSYGTKVIKHPDSGIRFSEFTIPYFEECKRQAIFLHSMLPDIHSIGWDIAIGENGPIFIEGNDNWEINGPQICNGGLKRLFLKYC